VFFFSSPSDDDGKSNDWKFNSVVTSLYTLLALIRTWPLAKTMDAVVDGDGYVFVNGFWWVATALSEWQNPFLSTHLFFPDGVSLAFHTVTYSNAFLFIPITKLLGANVAVNSAYLLSYILTAFFTYLLARDLTGSRLAAFFAGMIVSFGPYHMSSGSHHLNLTTIQWLVLYAIMLRRCMTGNDRRSPVIAGFVAALVIYTDHFQAILAIFLTCSLAIYHLSASGGRSSIQEIPPQRLFARLGIIAVIAALLVSPYAYAMLNDLVAQKDITSSFGVFETGGPNMFSGDLFGYFTPYPLGRYFDIYVLDQFSASLYLGVLPMATAVYGAVKNIDKRWIKALLLLAAVSFVLSLGPTLHLKDVWQWGGTYWRLPYYWLYDFPPFSIVRTPYRFHLVTVISVALISSAGIATLLKKFPSMICRYVAITAAVLLLLLDFPSDRYAGQVIPVNPIHLEIAADNEDGSVLDLPLSRWAQEKNGNANPDTFMYYQTIHGKKIFSGHITRVVLDHLDFNDEFLTLLCVLSSQDRINRDIGPDNVEGPLPISPEEAEQIGNIYAKDRDYLLSKFKVGHILLHDYTADENSLSARFMKGFSRREAECYAGIRYYRLTRRSEDRLLQPI